MQLPSTVSKKEQLLGQDFQGKGHTFMVDDQMDKMILQCTVSMLC